MTENKAGEHRDPRNIRRERGKQVIVTFTNDKKTKVEKAMLDKRDKKIKD